MNLADCYRILELRSGASLEAIKASYRRLARQYHPDVNPNNLRAKEAFIQITAAYRFLMDNLPDSPTAEPGSAPSKASQTRVVVRKQPGRVAVSTESADRKSDAAGVARKPTPIQLNDLSLWEQQLKASSYEQLQHLLKTQRFPRAIALVEGLAQRLPQDTEIVQWQAIAYQRWGRHLIQERQLDKARRYLKKALRTDPHNRSLWAEIEKDFQHIERLL